MRPGLRAEAQLVRPRRRHRALPTRSQRLRFEHPEVRALLVVERRRTASSAPARTSSCSGSSTHAFKVNFCKFTNETRLALEDASRHSGIHSVCAVNGPCVGRRLRARARLRRDPAARRRQQHGRAPRGAAARRAARHRRPDAPRRQAQGPPRPRRRVLHAGRGRQGAAREGVAPRRRRDPLVEVQGRRREAPRGGRRGAGARRGRAAGARASRWTPLGADVRARRRDVSPRDATRRRGRAHGAPRRSRRRAAAQPATAAEARAQGADWWILRAFRELDDALFDLRFNQPEIGLVLLETEGDPAVVRATDALLAVGEGRLVRLARSAASCGGRSSASTSPRRRSSRSPRPAPASSARSSSSRSPPTAST